MNNNLLFCAKQIRSFEKFAYDKLNLSEEILMERAGAAALRCLITYYPHLRNITICCGGGNNAGDGYVLARLAHERGYNVTINQYKAVEKLPYPARNAAKKAISIGVPCQQSVLSNPFSSKAELIVDALLGIGLKGSVRDPLANLIHEINKSNLPVLSLDIPSGLNSDTGQVMGVGVKADMTITFMAHKLGLMTLDGPDLCGILICDPLELDVYLAEISPAAHYLSHESPPLVFPSRLKNSHKANFGHVLIVGGNYGMPGSVVLAANAALRVGAGLVSVATRPEHASAFALLPEAMVYGVSNKKELASLLCKASFCIVGPGLGDDQWAKSLFQEVLDSDLTMLIDASALRLLSQQKKHWNEHWILTPHPGEAASLLHSTTSKVQSDRIQAATIIREQYGGNIVLKGAGTIIRTENSMNYVCCAGNPGMASAGMGDLLSGIIGGLVAQGLTSSEATILGVWTHATAGDFAARLHGERGLLASDLLSYLPRIINNKID